MKIILFGGAEFKDNMFIKQLELMEQVFNKLKPKQILHIPYARPVATEIEWDGDWFNRHMHLKNVFYLNAENKNDMKKVKNPLIFISGGQDNVGLLKKIKSNSKLLKLVKNAECIVGESAGAKVLGSYFREKGSDENSKVIKGLNIVKDTIIEPHYTQRNRQKLLEKDLIDSGVKYGLGIDCVTAIEFKNGEFPKKYEKIGIGNIFIKIQKI